jgi:hypothetical protein
VDERPLRVGSVFEWVAAALAVLGLLWLASVPLQRFVGRGVEAAITDEGETSSPPGVPNGAVTVPVILLRDGRELRQGDLQSRIAAVLPEKYADGPPIVSATELGERHTRAYRVDGARFYVVCERLERGGPMKIAGIYLP